MRISRRKALSEHDRATWALYVRNVSPLLGVPVPDAPPEPALPPQPSLPPVPPVSLPTIQRLSLVTIGHHPPGVDKATWHRFRAGKLPASRTLDLHGRTAQRAFFALQDFLGSAHAERLRCVEVITGRGSGETGGVIRREFPLWLNRPELRPLVLAAAHPHAANPGSVRLLLRRVRPGK
jgi:DNA-nicking Smr family endonuclease